MFVLTAYAPPTFLTPVLVWQTCQCNDTGDGAHILGCWVDALNVDHAWRVLGQGLADAHSNGPKWFLIGNFPSPFSALEIHTKMAFDMQNGGSNEQWEAGYEPYLRIYEQFKDAPPYRSA